MQLRGKEVRAKMGVSETMAVGLGKRGGCGIRVCVAWVYGGDGRGGDGSRGLDICR
jgi:hypothetical protein